MTYDFGNTLVRVDRAGSRAVAAATAQALLRAGIVDEPATFLAVWAEERDRQFREEVPAGREVDLRQRFVRTLARLRGFPPPPADGRWDDPAAEPFADPAEISTGVDAYSRAFIRTMQPIAGAGDHLARMHARGFRLAVLSNWPLAATIDRYLQAKGWLPFFDAVVVSQRVGAIKPQPEIFREAARLLGSPPQRILHVGDDWAADVVGATRAGWHAAYLRGRQGDTPLPTSAPGDDASPDLVIDELAELEAAVAPVGPT
ncbi:MAG TPA: HAD family hydrolase [Candidatus Limnocylindrales bacterium]|nr:HAD family hydrolase [Candidatus Limnocylindrales bacterium]